MAEGEKNASSEVTFKGVANVMEDTKNFSTFLQSLESVNNDETSVLQFNCDRKNFFMDGCNAFLEWTSVLSGSDQVRILAC